MLKFPKLSKVAVPVLVMVLGLAGGIFLRPTTLSPYLQNDVKLADAIPKQVGRWRAIERSGAVLPIGDYRASTDIYDQELSRTYVDEAGNIIMLVIAFGHNQSDKLQLHRPEICYRAAGYKVSGVQASGLRLNQGSSAEIPVTQLMSRRLTRREPVTYWTRVGAEIPRDVIWLQLMKLWTGLQGKIPDGALVRISNLSGDPEQSFALHREFAHALVRAASPAGRQMLIGRYAEQVDDTTVALDAARSPATHEHSG